MGIGWSTDYPYAGINLMIRMSELTRAHITQVGESGEPNYWVVRLTDDALFHCPILMGSDVGTMGAFRSGGGAAAPVPAERRVSLGRRFLGHAGMDAVVRSDSQGAAWIRDL